MKVLVTGGAGYIGSHVLIELLNNGYEPVVVDNFSNSSPSNIDAVKKICGANIPFSCGDITNKKIVRELFLLHKFDSVIHLAGLKSIKESFNYPLKYYKNNVMASLTLLEVMQEFDVKNIVFSSSATVYGQPSNLPITESMQVQSPINPYGKSKLLIETILDDLYVSDNGWRIIKLRYFNPIGAHQSGLIGENNLRGANNIMPMILEVACGEKEKLTIYGNDYETQDGTGVRDYIHVEDLAKGHIRALKRIQEKKGNLAINLGTGKGHSVLDLVKTFEEATGKKIPYKFSERRSGDIACCYTDSSHSKKILNWTANKNLKEMCLDSWRWKLKNYNN